MRPELRGLLWHAQRHLLLATRRGRGFRAAARRARHWSKVQKLLAKAARTITDRELEEIAPC